MNNLPSMNEQEIREYYAEEANKILRILFKRYNATYYEDENKNIQEILKISRMYRNPEKKLTCKQVVADNLYVRRLVLGESYEELSSFIHLPAKVIKKYEEGKRSVFLHPKEIIEIAITYKYLLPDELRDMFIYGFEFHELVRGSIEFLPDKSSLILCENPFFKK